MVLRPSWRAGVAGLALIASAAAGIFDGRDPVENSGRWRRIQTPELTGATRIAEDFSMYFPALTAIELSAAATGAPTGTVDLTLSEVNGTRTTVVRTARVPAADMVRDEWYVFRFRPIGESRGKRYRIDVSANETSGGVALWATKGRRLPESAMWVDGTDRMADLVFRTRVVTMPPRPRLLLSLAMTMLALSWLTVLYLLRRIAP